MTQLQISAREIARSIQLRYIASGQPGFSRRLKGKSFIYFDPEGRQIKEQEILDRIRALVLPPAWTNVWICRYANGHLQATGIDARGRKQYRYHAKWSKVRNDQKHDRIYGFGCKLPLLRRQIIKDIRQRTLAREKVSAIALSVMNETYIRSGNAAYEKAYGSFGLTTLKNKHIDINGSKAFFRFKGKKGVLQKIELNDASLTRLLKKVKELPGQELFQYYDETGTIRRLESGDINDYLRTHMRETFTCKDFRTWAGSVLALQLMALSHESETQQEAKRNIVTIIDGVASKLGNTRTVCRKYYIHPALLQSYEERKLDTYLKALRRKAGNKNWNRDSEKILLSFLKSMAGNMPGTI